MSFSHTPKNWPQKLDYLVSHQRKKLSLSKSKNFKIGPNPMKFSFNTVDIEKLRRILDPLMTFFITTSLISRPNEKVRFRRRNEKLNPVKNSKV